MDKKVIRIPISRKERNYNLHETGYVPCYVTDRWLQFDDTYDSNTGLVFADVMTLDSNENPKKICNLCLNINELKQEIQKIKPK